MAFFFFPPSFLAEEQQWADNYSRQNAAAPNGFNATAETQPRMAPNQAAPYDGTLKLKFHLTPTTGS